MSTVHIQNSRGSGDARTLPNDPERQGNIWSRYEQLENSSKALANVNQQLIDERSQRKKVCTAGHLMLEISKSDPNYQLHCRGVLIMHGAGC